MAKKKKDLSVDSSVEGVVIQDVIVENNKEVEAVTLICKHFTPNNVDYNVSPVSQMRYGSKANTTGVVLANSKGQGFYMHSLASLGNMLYREDNLSPVHRDKLIKLVIYANKNFLSIEKYNKSITNLMNIYKNNSSDLCKRIIKTLWVNTSN